MPDAVLTIERDDDGHRVAVMRRAPLRQLTRPDA